jgi:hypothetical protein
VDFYQIPRKSHVNVALNNRGRFVKGDYFFGVRGALGARCFTLDTCRTMAWSLRPNHGIAEAALGQRMFCLDGQN